MRRLPAGAGEPSCWTTPGSILNPTPPQSNCFSFWASGRENLLQVFAKGGCLGLGAGGFRLRRGRSHPADMARELEKPGRDPRQSCPLPFSAGM